MTTKLIIDTDPGVDDAFAIALAALSDDVDLLGVTTVFGNVGVETTTRNARRLLALCKRGDVPVAQGAARPLVHEHPHRARYAHGADGLSGRSAALPEAERPVEAGGAVWLLSRLLEQSDEPVTIAPIGPLTNIASLLSVRPDLHHKIARVVIMGGALLHGNTTAAAEFNIWSDPEAAHRVLTGGEVPCVLVPMDLTYRCAVDLEWLDALTASGPVGAALTALTPDYLAHYRKALGWDGMVIHDAVAVAEVIRPGILRTVAVPVAVETSFGPSRGATVVDQRRPELRADTDGATTTTASTTVHTAVDTDLDALRAFLLERLTMR
ncbi:nucleoside hydrolase [Saccharomonospora xinjiangensis]|uniref:Inosine-uridine nucleoside N-ribohydrolase n=1 Tax=Saccharomonospora xinjiangensis XJ-54 TaxID=882086 RepID=I0V600_9PSEU|nr:nucleoside hydrolase [Saccharomonospora xinjiangensis]EID55553.1 Inosine-uridine nucleoside N-ribohydrolase [Saccharomonospora xinjiangensis XJ-54]